MPEHHTKNTLEVTAWCAKCQKRTQHRVDGGRQGPCIDEHHGDQSPLRDGAAGERPFRVVWIDTTATPPQRNFREFRTASEALQFFEKQPAGTATLSGRKEQLR